MNLRERKMHTRLKKMQALALELEELGYTFSERDTAIVLIDNEKPVEIISLGTVAYGFGGGFQDTSEVIGRLYE